MPNCDEEEYNEAEDDKENENDDSRNNQIWKMSKYLIRVVQWQFITVVKNSIQNIC